MVRFFLTLLLAIKSPAADIINAKRLFEVKVNTPTHMTECLQKIWVFSKQDKSLYIYSKHDGRRLAQFTFNEKVSTLSCFKSKLIVAVSNVGLKAFELDERIQLKQTQFFKTPLSGLITDLQCGSTQCYIVGTGQVFKTKDLAHWIQIKLRGHENIPHKNVDLSTNPFDDWQEKLLITKGTITKVAPLDGDRFALLDPFRANILINNKDEWIRWGKWGAWEGSFLAPKALSYGFPNILFVSDPHLKVISVFNDDGRYLGLIGENSAIIEVSYPTQIHFSDDKLFIADFLENKLIGLEVSAYEIKKNHLNDSSSESFRYNLFRRESVLVNREKNKCLLCHDGTMRDDTAKYINSHNQHPIKTTCTECHDPHHNKKLKKPQQQLCMSCHAEHVKVGHKIDQCTDCHSAHNGVVKTLKSELPSLCLQCHQTKKFEHRATEHMLTLENAKSVKFLKDKISCTTCHTLHGQKVKPDNIMPFCANCHGSKADGLFKNFHKRFGAK